MFLKLLRSSVIVALLLRTATPAPDQFVESFDGNGPFNALDFNLSGFDNPGWSIMGDIGEDQFIKSNPFFVDGGIRLENFGQNTQLDSDFDIISRDIFGADNFFLIVKIKDLDFAACDVPGEICVGPSGGASVTLSHVMDTGSGDELTFSVFAEPTFEPLKWSLLINIEPESQQFEVTPGPDMLLGMNFEEQSITFRFDNNLSDNVDPISYGPFDYIGRVSDSQTTSLTVGVSGPLHNNGTIDEWIFARDFDTADFNKNGELDTADVELLIAEIRNGANGSDFDLVRDNVVDEFDLSFWVHERANTFFGDSNLDGEFNSSDLISVFQADEYEDNTEMNSTWSTGDWNGDGDFTSRDLVFAFGDGGYEMGPRVTAQSVPEPYSIVVGLVLPFIALMLLSRSHVATRPLP